MKKITISEFVLLLFCIMRFNKIFYSAPLNHCELNIFGFWTVGQSEDVMDSGTSDELNE